MRPVVVLGDTLLDVDVDGRTERMCPDAPVPVLDVTAERARPGGAGLAAAMLAAAEQPVMLVTALAEDADGARLRTLLEPMVVAGARARSRRHAGQDRASGPGSSLLRVDRGEGRPAAGFGDAVDAALAAALARAAAVLVSDYGRGVAADPAVRAALTAAVRRGFPWCGTRTRAVRRRCPASPWPPRTSPRPGPRSTRTPVCPSRTWRPGGARRWSCRAVAVTVGERGAVLARRDGAGLCVPARRVTDGDPCGAGDAFAGRVAALLAQGAAVDAAVRGAVSAAQAFVGGRWCGRAALRLARAS